MSFDIVVSPTLDSCGQVLYVPYLCVNFDARSIVAGCVHPAYANTPIAVREHRAIEWSFPRRADADDVRRLVDSVLPLLDELDELFEGVQWTGCGRRGQWSDWSERDRLIEAVERELSGVDDDHVCDAEEWLRSGEQPFEDVAREILACEDPAEEIEERARCAGVYLLDVNGAVRALRDAIAEY